MSNKLLFGLYICLCTALACLHCSMEVSGGGTEDVNTMTIVAGTVVDQFGEPAPNTRMQLVPPNYNPVKDAAIADSMIDTTDSEGLYTFTVSNSFSGIFNLSGNRLSENERLLVAGVSITADSSIDTTFLDEVALSEPGALRIVLADTFDLDLGYFFIPGTDLYEKISEEQIITDISGASYIIFDALPSGVLPGVSYNNEGSTTGSSLLKDSIDIFSNDTSDLILGGYAVVLGRVLYATTLPAPDVSVYLIPDNHNPCLDTNTILKTSSTDNSGDYVFSLVKTGTYNIQANDPDNGHRFLMPGIVVDKDTIQNSFEALQEPGALLFTLPDTVDTVNGYVYIPGTILCERLSGEQLIYDNGLLHMVFDSLPKGMFSGVYYGEINSQNDPVSITGDFIITAGDTTDLSITKSWNFYTAANSGIPQDNINVVMVDASGIVWLGTQDSGLVKFDGFNWTVYNTENSLLPHNTILGICQDKDGSIWVGTVTTIVKINNGTWTEYKEENSNLAINFITGIAIDSIGNRWFGTTSGCIRFDGDNWSLTTYTEIYPMSDVNALTVNTKGELIVGARYGLFTQSQKGWKRILVASLSWDKSMIFDVAVDKNNVIWCATGFGLFAYGDSQWKEYNSTNSGLPVNEIRSVSVDAWNNIWVGTQNEGNVVKIGTVGGVFTPVNTPVLQDAGSINCIAAVGSSRVYFATALKGLIQVTFISSR